MKLIWLFFAFSPNILLITANIAPLDNMVTSDAEGHQCVTQRKSYKLDIENNELQLLFPLKGSPGEKGDMGTVGYPGEPGFNGVEGLFGEKGDKGERGLDGQQGQPGYKGDSGPHGQKGQKGERGLHGASGPVGLPGQPGIKGEMGLPGYPGLKGDRGLPGPPGLPGLMGSCPCINPEIKSDAVPTDNDDEFGTWEHPMKVLCKDATFNITMGNDYYMGQWPIKVNCIMIDDRVYTCIPPTSNENYTNVATLAIFNSEPSWMQPNIEKLYGLTHAQITWIQERSIIAFQKIEYQCMNNAPYRLMYPELSLLMLSWNEVIIGPKSSDSTPMFYNIPPAFDGCVQQSDLPYEPGSSIIHIETDSAQRLPILDFLIRDVLYEGEKTVTIKHLDLCFH